MEHNNITEETLEILRPVADMTGLSIQMCQVLIGVGLLVVLLSAQSIYGALTAKKSGAALSSQSGNNKKVRDFVLLVGPSNAGKTALFYKLLTRQDQETVSSVDINQTEDLMEVKIPSSVAPRQTTPSVETDGGEQEQVSIALKMVDIPGHFNFREKMLEALDSAKAVILIVDAKDKDKFGEAAEILYDVIGNLGIVTDSVPVAVACNKQDLTFAKKAIQIERDLSTQIEQIRKVRKASREQEQDTTQAANKISGGAAMETSQGDTSYLESLKGRFAFDQLATPVQFFDSSIVQGNLDEVYRFVYKYAA